MRDVLEICCGLDVHKESVVACLLKGNTDGKPQKSIRTFSTLLSGLDERKACLKIVGMSPWKAPESIGNPFTTSRKKLLKGVWY